MRPLVAAALVLAAGACRGSGADVGYPIATGGDPQVGRTLIRQRRCGACHEVPGVTGAHGAIGPSLRGFARRSFLAGGTPNTPPNLVRWLLSPHQLQPGTAMPALGLDDGQARAIAAYLYMQRQETR